MKITPLILYKVYGTYEDKQIVERLGKDFKRVFHDFAHIKLDLNINKLYIVD